MHCVATVRLLVPKTTTRDGRLLRRRPGGAVRSLDERGGSLLDLQATVQEPADKWSLVATDADAGRAHRICGGRQDVRDAP
jgi:hypothetical protein